MPGSVRWGDGALRAALVFVPEGRDARSFARDRALGRSVDEGLVEGRDFVLADAFSLGLDRDPRLWVGAPRVGERMRPFGLGGGKLVSDVVSEAGVPRRDRARVPVVRARDGAGGSSVVWVGGIRLDERAAYRPETRALVELTFWNPAPPAGGAAGSVGQRAR